MTSFEHSEEAQSLLVPLEHRLRDLRDWLDRVPLPPNWHITTLVQKDAVVVTLNLKFDSYKEANVWAWNHTVCHEESPYGYHHMGKHDGFLHILLSDFQLFVSFPPETHPDRLNPELSHLQPATA